MTQKIDRLMVNLGFSKSEVRKARYRRFLYLAIIAMSAIALCGIALNIGLYAG